MYKCMIWYAHIYMIYRYATYTYKSMYCENKQSAVWWETNNCTFNIAKTGNLCISIEGKLITSLSIESFQRWAISQACGSSVCCWKGNLANRPPCMTWQWKKNIIPTGADFGSINCINLYTLGIGCCFRSPAVRSYISSNERDSRWVDEKTLCLWWLRWFTQMVFTLPGPVHLVLIQAF